MLKVGGNVDAFCSRCRMDLAHTIHAIVAATPARVECNTCHAVHQYKAPKGKTSPVPAGFEMTRASARSPSSSSSSSRRSSQEEASSYLQPTSPEEEWEYLMKHNRATLRNYRMSESYEKGQALMHPSFGIGFVESRTAPQKICVLFRDGRKVLLDSRTS